MSAGRKAVSTMLPKAVRNLRFPQLFVLTVVLFVLDLLIPDLVPFIDEILLGLASLLLAGWRQRPVSPEQERQRSGDPHDPDSGPVIDVEPED